MAEIRSDGMSDERIKDAASETVRAGVDIRDKVRELTLLALQSYRFDRHGIRDVVRSVTEGAALGAEKNRTGIRQAMSEALSGLDQALRTSAEAGHTALKQLASTGKDFSDGELKQALANLRRLEEDFLSTVGQVADKASERVQPQLREALSAARRTGTETGKQVATVMSEFAHRFSVASIDATIHGLEAAGEFGQRFALVTSGILAGIAEALRPPASSERKTSQPKEG
jgi:hypothetical protein